MYGQRQRQHQTSGRGYECAYPLIHSQSPHITPVQGALSYHGTMVLAYFAVYTVSNTEHPTPWRLHSIRYAPKIEVLRMRFADQLWRMLKLDGGGTRRKDFEIAADR